MQQCHSTGSKFSCDTSQSGIPHTLMNVIVFFMWRKLGYNNISIENDIVPLAQKLFEAKKIIHNAHWHPVGLTETSYSNVRSITSYNISFTCLASLLP